MKLLVDERDVKFVLYEQLRIEDLCKSPVYADLSQETFDMVLEEAGKLAERSFYPSNKLGDEQGCRWKTARSRPPIHSTSLTGYTGRAGGLRCRTRPKSEAKACRLYWGMPVLKCLARPTGRSLCTPG